MGMVSHLIAWSLFCDDGLLVDGVADSRRRVLVHLVPHPDETGVEVALSSSEVVADVLGVAGVGAEGGDGGEGLALSAHHFPLLRTRMGDDFQKPREFGIGPGRGRHSEDTLD